MNLKYPIWICFVVLMLLSICCAMAGQMPMTALVYLGVLGGIAAAGLGFLCWRTLKELGELTRSLSAEKPFVAAEVTLLKPLVRALNTALQEASGPMQTARQDNQDLNLQLQLLRRRKNGVETILNSIQDAVLVVDSQDRLILANSSAEKLFSFKFDPSRLQILSDAIGQSALLDMMLKARNSRVCHVRHELTISSDGENICFDCVLSCVTDDAGRPVSVVAILHDVTREKEISRAKNEFVSHVSHELKTPLASINAYAEMLADGDAKDTQTIRQYCEIIQGQAHRLNRLIEDVLNISRIESGLIKVNRQTHSLALILRDSLEMMQSYAKEKNITIHTPPSILFDQVCVDKDMMTQVVVNLLSNAVKYTPAGGQVTVQIEVNDVEGTITVSVTDTGIGIPEQEMNKLFGKFYRVEANKNFAKGTGLGLNLVKQIVETVHGGQVFVRSQQGKGSTFGFVLPLAAAGQLAV
jgi:two-component system phosphate regulon sensor histidine kinase PhoR